LRLILPLCDDRCVTDMALKSSKNLDWERIIYKAWPFPAKGPKLLPNHGWRRKPSARRTGRAGNYFRGYRVIRPEKRK
jgi:hypothetical protein